MIDLKLLKELSNNFTVLYVEDDEKLRKAVSQYLERFFLNVDCAADGEEGLALYSNNKYDLVLSDIKMPKLNGLEMVEKIKDINEHQNILIISAYSEIENFTTSIKLGVDGYILKPIDYNQLNSALYKIVFKIKQFKENIAYKENLEKLVEEKTIEAKSLQDEKIKNYQKTLLALVKMIEDRDTYTGGHSQRVATYSKMIASKFGLDDTACENIYQAGILHDIGKIAIPDTILLKPGSLNEIEYHIIQEHVAIGVGILNKIPMFKELSVIIEAHHERFDGSGYPNSLKGDEIVLEAQIMALADAFDAMTTSRIYKAKKSVSEAIQEIQSLRDIHFRGDIVDIAAEVLDTVHIDDTISQLPTNELEKERFSYFYKDQVTQSYNLNYFDLILIKNSYNFKYQFIYQFNIHNIHKFNSKNGWDKGNEYLNNISIYLNTLSKNMILFRIYGDNFIVLSSTSIAINNDEIKKIICVDDIEFELLTYDIEKQSIFSVADFELLR